MAIVETELKGLSRGSKAVDSHVLTAFRPVGLLDVLHECDCGGASLTVEALIVRCALTTDPSEAPNVNEGVWLGWDSLSNTSLPNPVRTAE